MPTIMGPATLGWYKDLARLCESIDATTAAKAELEDNFDTQVFKLRTRIRALKEQRAVEVRPMDEELHRLQERKKLILQLLRAAE